MIKIIDNIILLGTSHVAHQSKKEIEETIEKYLPEVVGIELDFHRFQALMSENKDKKKNNYTRKLIKEIGFSGYMFALIAGYVQQKVGESMNIEPGIDMKSAYLKAREHKIPTALIDIDIRLTLKKLSALSFGKKISMFSSLFFKSFKKEYREKLQFDVKKGVPDEKVIVEMLQTDDSESLRIAAEICRMLLDRGQVCEPAITIALKGIIKEFSDEYKGLIRALFRQGLGFEEAKQRALEWMGNYDPTQEAFFWLVHLLEDYFPSKPPLIPKSLQFAMKEINYPEINHPLLGFEVTDKEMIVKYGLDRTGLERVYITLHYDFLAQTTLLKGKIDTGNYQEWEAIFKCS